MLDTLQEILVVVFTALADTIFRRVSGSLSSSNRPRQEWRKSRPAIEGLETREVMTATAIPFSIPPSAPPSQPAPIVNDNNSALMSMVTNSLLQQSLYSQRGRFMLTPNADGTVGTNEAYATGHSNTFLIENQRYGGDAIMVAAQTGNQSLMTMGWSMIDYATNHLASPDGSFSKSLDTFHSCSLFLAEVLEGIFVVEQMNAVGSHQAELNLALKDCQATANWMMGAGRSMGWSGDAQYDHRRFAVGFDLLMLTKLTGNTTYANQAIPWIQDGLSKQFGAGTSAYTITNTATGAKQTISRVGVFPEAYHPGENSGWDVNYQAVALKYASLDWAILSAGPLRDQLQTAVTAGFAFESQLASPNGTIEINGSTRMLNESNNVTGLPKTPNYCDVITGLAYASVSTNSSAPLTLAKALAKGQKWQ